MSPHLLPSLLMCHTPHTPHSHIPCVTTTRLDVFAVRQWPGNGADLDFRGVLKGCTAAIVAAAPIEGTLLKDAGSEGGMRHPDAREAFLKSDEYAAVAKVLPFCRLWCVHAGWHLSPLAHPVRHTTLSVHQSHTLIHLSLIHI